MATAATFRTASTAEGGDLHAHADQQGRPEAAATCAWWISSGNQLAGGRPRTSEILLHLEIYKAVPEAKAVVHCHPAHATAYAITGRVPPSCVIPEYEVFIGKVALSPYETPGTQKFAETVIPFVKKHNTVLLANHGIVCWADTRDPRGMVCGSGGYVLLDADAGFPTGRAALSHPIRKDRRSAGHQAALGLPDVRMGMQECRSATCPSRPARSPWPPTPARSAPRSRR